MFKNIAFLLLSIIVFTNQLSAQKKVEATRYRAGINVNGLRVRTLELSGQALKGGKFIYNANLGFTYKTPFNGYQTKAQKNSDSLTLDIKTSGVFVKLGVQANLFAIANRFSKADIFIGSGLTNTWYNRSAKVKDLSIPNSKPDSATYSGSKLVPYISVGGNLRLLYNVYLDLGFQYSLGNTQTVDKLTPKRYEYLPGMGGNYKNGNKVSILFMARYEFDLAKKKNK